MTRVKINIGDLDSGNAEKTFESIFHAFQPKVKGFLRSFVQDKSIADDLVQEVFINLLKKKDDLLEIKDLDSYIFITAKNVLWHYIKDKDRHRNVPMESISCEGNEFRQVEQDAEELERIILEFVGKMPWRRQECFRLSRFENLSNDMIAVRMGISKRTVETHISAALKELRRMILGSDYSDFLKMMLIFFFC